MKKNGFVFAETIIVVSILSLTLLMLYSSYSYILRKTKEKRNDDTVDTIYQTYYFKQVMEKYALKKYGNDNILSFVINHTDAKGECKEINRNPEIYVCDMEKLVDPSTYNDFQHDLESLYHIYGARKYYYVDIEYVKSNINQNNIMNALDATTIDYINNFPSDTTGKYLIVKYVRNEETMHSSIEVIP